MSHFGIKVFTIVAVLAIGGLIIPSCNNSPDVDCFNEWDPKSLDPCNNTTYISDNFTINILPAEQLPYIAHAREYSPREFYDSDSVPMFFFKEEAYFHPILIAQYSFEILNLYYKDEQRNHLSHLQTQVNRLLDEANMHHSALYFPYNFDFTLHKCPDETLYSPWYSGMAQGQVLSLFCRLFEITADSSLLDNSTMVFQSLINFKGDGKDPWVSCIDSTGHLWFEEYPIDPPAYTLNGMIFAIFGVYDYYRITGDKYALSILQASITTIKKNIHLYRNEGDISYYCLKHKLKNLDYHNIHIGQLHSLYLITGDEYFEQVSLQLQADTDNLD